MPQPWECNEWVQSYHAALLELDLQKLPARIEAANRAIHARLRQLSTSDHGDGHQELSAIEDALGSLRNLTKERR